MSREEMLELANRVDRANRNLEWCERLDPMMRLHYLTQRNAYIERLEHASARASLAGKE